MYLSRTSRSLFASDGGLAVARVRKRPERPFVGEPVA